VAALLMECPAAVPAPEEILSRSVERAVHLLPAPQAKVSFYSVAAAGVGMQHWPQ